MIRNIEDQSAPPMWCRFIVSTLGRFGFKLWLKLGATFYTHVMISKDLKLITFADSEWTLVNKLHDFKESDIETKPRDMRELQI